MAKDTQTNGYQPIGPAIAPHKVFEPGQAVSAAYMPGCQQLISGAVVTDMQMYLAFSAEHLRDAANALEKAIAAQPQLLGHWHDVLVMWRAQLPVLQAEAETKVTGERP